MDNKFRYVFKNNKTHEILFEYFTFEQIERGEAKDKLAKLELEWTVISRDEWTGIQDKNGNDLYGNNRVVTRQYIGGNWVENVIKYGTIEFKFCSWICRFDDNTFRRLDQLIEYQVEIEIIGTVYDKEDQNGH